jgi:hypothetical protein
MRDYKVRIKNSKKFETIKAKSLLDAKVLFCEKRGLTYRHYAGKIEVLDETGQTGQDK